MPRRASLALFCGVLSVCFVLAADSLAGEGDANKAKSAEAARAKDHLPFHKTYADALLEARIRNLPVFVSRHKDF